MRRVVPALLAILFALCLSQPALASAGKRVALVIGNGDYSTYGVLKNARRDAEDMAATLRKMGYDVLFGDNLTTEGFKLITRKFVDRLNNADLALFYYAGHGIQSESTNYILPVNADLKTKSDIIFDAIPVEDIVRVMERNARTTVVLLDSCRDDPFLNRALAAGTRGVGAATGFVPETPATGTYIAFAAQPGRTAFDGVGQNSPFTAALLRHIGEASVDIRIVMSEVRRDVMDATAGRQIPWDASSLIGTLTLDPAPAASAAEPRLEIIPVQPTTGGAATGAQGSPHASPPAPAVRRSPDRPVAEKAAPDLHLSALDPLAAFSPTGGPVFDLTPQPPRKPQAKPPAPSTAPATSAPAGNASAKPNPGAPVFTKADLALLMKGNLKRVGCDPGALDSTWGDDARRSLAQFAKYSGIKIADLDPDIKTLERIEAHRSRVCPIACGAGTRLEGDRCVAIRCKTGFALDKKGRCVAVKAALPRPSAKRSSAPARKRKSQSAHSRPAMVVRGSAEHMRLRGECRSGNAGACEILCHSGAWAWRACRKVQRLKYGYVGGRHHHHRM